MKAKTLVGGNREQLEAIAVLENYTFHQELAKQIARNVLV